MEINEKSLMMSTAPHIVTDTDTSKIMKMVILSLVPAGLVGVYVFGLKALVLILTCMIASTLFEYIYNKLMKKEQTAWDCSAALTGMLIAYNVPSSLPIPMAIVGCFVAIVIVKQLYGGIGQNLVNPAITARIVLMTSFATQMTSWPVPRGSKGFSFMQGFTDTTTAATPLGVLAEGGDYMPSNMQLFLGNVGGSLGEVSALALLAGGAFLLWKRIITWHIPVAYMVTVVAISLLLGQDPIFHLCAGGVMLGAIFMATDYVTSPTIVSGKIIFGVGAALIAMVIRLYGQMPEGVSFGILLMNILTPHVDKLAVRLLTRKGGAKNAK